MCILGHGGPVRAIERQSQEEGTIMRAYQVIPEAGIEGIQAVEVADPRPGPGEVLVRVRAASLNYRDLMITRSTRRPVVPLSDGAGEVVEVGAGVTAFAPGDRVCGCFFPSWPDGDRTPEYTRDALGGTVDGVLAEQVVLPAAGLVHAPAHMTFEEASTLPCAALTAWNGLYEVGRLRPGATALILGTGGVSIFGLQMAHLGGVRTIVTSSSDAKLERARALGADEVINYREVADWDRAVLDLTDGRGVDLVLEVGGAGTYAKSMAATKVDGHVILIGGLAPDPGGAPTPMPGRVIATRINVGSRVMFERMNRALELREVHPVIDRVFGFAEAAAAYRHLQSQTHLGKVVISLS
jgi:NADPH:quinone reductase-like Zn-dependent oxidoreductase